MNIMVILCVYICVRAWRARARVCVHEERERGRERDVPASISSEKKSGNSNVRLHFSSYSCEATTIIVLIILSLYGRSAAQKNKTNQKHCFELLQSGGP